MDAARDNPVHHKPENQHERHQSQVIHRLSFVPSLILSIDRPSYQEEADGENHNPGREGQRHPVNCHLSFVPLADDDSDPGCDEGDKAEGEHAADNDEHRVKRHPRFVPRSALQAGL